MHKKRVIIGAMIVCLSGCCFAATHYVALDGTNNSPYLTWADAATNIQWAVDVATNGETVLVSNGTYNLTNQIIITSNITVRSANGRDFTFINGNYPAYTNRCVYMTNGVLDGFTISNGFMLGYGGADITNGYGGGVYSKGVVERTIKNCRITGCVATNVSGSGAKGGGVYNNAINIAFDWRMGSVIDNCEVIGNISYNGAGGGIFTDNALVTNCTIAGNTNTGSAGETRAGGISASGDTLISNCKIYGNVGAGGNNYGGGVDLNESAIIRNSLLYGNQGDRGGGILFYHTSSKIQNCTVVSNTGRSAGGGIFVITPAANTNCIENTICYFNMCSSGSNINVIVAPPAYIGSCQIVNSCIAPTNAFPTAGIVGYYYTNNIEANPQFVDKDANNWRLSANSPCINAGTNQSWMTGAVDLDGRTRIRYGTVDMGAFELILSGTIYGFH